MRVRRAAVLCCIVAGCRDAAPSTPTPTPTSVATAGVRVAVHRMHDEIGAEALVAGQAADLWHWCDGPGITAVAAKAAGRVVVGACADRARRWFSLRLADDGQAVGELRRDGPSGPVVAHLVGVERLVLDTDTPSAAPTPVPPLQFFVDGVAVAPLESHASIDAELDAADDGEGQDASRRHHRLGRSLMKVLVALGLKPGGVMRVELESRTTATPTRKQFDRAWLSTPGHDLLLRTNRRGLWRASVIAGDREIDKASGLVAIYVFTRA